MIADVSEPIVATQVAISEVTSTACELAVIIMTSKGTSTIPLLPVIIPWMATPLHNPTTGLVTSRKGNTIFSFQFFCIYIYNQLYFRNWLPTNSFYI